MVANMTPAFKQYIETALWSSTDHAGDLLDKFYDAGDIAPETLEKMRTDWEAFCKRAGELGLMSVPFRDLTDIAHDFWLSHLGRSGYTWGMTTRFTRVERSA